MDRNRLADEKTEDHAEDNPALNKAIERNIRTIIRLRLKAARERSLHDHIADAITAGQSPRHEPESKEQPPSSGHGVGRSDSTRAAGMDQGPLGRRQSAG